MRIDNMPPVERRPDPLEIGLPDPPRTFISEAPRPPAPAAHVVALARVLQNHLHAGADDVEIEVVLEDLGRIRIRVTRFAGRLRVRLRAVRRATRRLLAEHQETLRSHLLAAGYPCEIESANPDE